VLERCAWGATRLDFGPGLGVDVDGLGLALGLGLGLGIRFGLGLRLGLTPSTVRYTHHPHVYAFTLAALQT
jgi:hypothetical protein